MDTKQKGDIAEQAVVLQAMKQGFDVFYVMPCDVFIDYGSEIHFVEATKRQRKPKSSEFRNAWDLILQWAIPEGILE